MFIPILHSYCHNFKCRSRYCPRHIFGIGLKDGENAERFWSRLAWNAHYRYMRPENRRDFISAHVNLLDQKSFNGLSSNLKSKLKKAKKMAFELLKCNPRSYALVRQAIQIENDRSLNLQSISS